MRKPKKLPVSPACGPSLPPPEWDGYEDMAKAARNQKGLNMVYGSFRAKMLPVLLHKLQIIEALVEDLCKPPKFVQVSATAQCASYLLKPSHATTWRHLQDKFYWYTYFVTTRNAKAAKDIWVYMVKFIPNHGKPPEWLIWKSALKSWRTVADADLLEAVQWLGELAAKHEKEQSAASFKQWQRWVVKQGDTLGSALLHKFIKGPTPWAQFDMTLGCGCPQEDANNRAKNWHAIWKVKQLPPEIVLPVHIDLPMDGIPVDVEMVREVAATYKTITAIGGDWLHPEHFGLLSDGTIAAMLMLARVMVMLGLVPEQVEWLFIAFIPQALGGERPIGIFTSFIRVVSKIIRLTYSSIWLRLNDRQYIYGRKGRSAITCAWRHSFLAEHATYTGRYVAAVLLDIAKAYDSVDHLHLVAQAEKYHYNLGILRWLLKL